MLRAWSAALLTIAVLLSATSVAAGKPILIAHRGASGDRPEHTLAAYVLAIEHGADFIEPDLVLTRDGVLVSRHENEISGTTDVAERPEFASRKAIKTIDDVPSSGWFTEDFTLAELKTLRARERLPLLRPANTKFDGQFTIPTFDEILDLVRQHEKRSDRRIGIYPETKHPSYFAGIKLPHTAPLLAALRRHGYRGRNDAVFIQSFEVGNLIDLNRKSRYRLIQLIAQEGGPFDRKDAGLRFVDMVKPQGLKAIAQYADGIGAEKSLVIARAPDGTLGAATGLSQHAKTARLELHVWTFRAENYFLPTEAQSARGPAARGDLAAEVRAFVTAGADGIFSDHVELARAALNQIDK